MISRIVKEEDARRAALKIALAVFEHRQSKYTLGSTNVSTKL